MQACFPLMFPSVQGTAECATNYDCHDEQVCHEGSCQNACRFKRCGQNALCKAQAHKASCQCFPNHQGNPELICESGEICMQSPSLCRLLNLFLSSEPVPVIEPVNIGCESNEECPDYAACQNKKCINPCALGDPCAPLASCKVSRHETICTCPDGFIGSPETECQPRELLR